MAASERRFGSRHRNPFSTSRAVRLIVGAIVRGGHRIRGTKTISPRPVARTVDYPPGVRAVLDHAKATHGDTVLVRAKGERYEGTLMPHHGFSGEDILTVKLPSGYNIGIAVGDIDAVEVTAKHEATRAERRLPPPTKDKLTVAVLGTGGTIASYVDYRTGAVHPAVTAEELVFSVPELLDVCNIRARVIYSIYSENLKPENWQRLAREAAKEFESGAAGVVIPHGTHTLHFTTAALSFMLRDLTAPVVVVGAQRSSDRPSSDAATNLLGAARVATADLGEVVAVMHGETSDSFGVIHRGTKVRKMHSSRRVPILERETSGPRPPGRPRRTHGACPPPGEGTDEGRRRARPRGRAHLLLPGAAGVGTRGEPGGRARRRDRGDWAGPRGPRSDPHAAPGGPGRRGRRHGDPDAPGPREHAGVRHGPRFDEGRGDWRRRHDAGDGLRQADVGPRSHPRTSGGRSRDGDERRGGNQSEDRPRRVRGVSATERAR